MIIHWSNIVIIPSVIRSWWLSPWIQNIFSVINARLKLAFSVLNLGMVKRSLASRLSLKDVVKDKNRIKSFTAPCAKLKSNALSAVTT